MNSYNGKVIADDGKPVEFPPPPGSISLVCCHCGLTHDVDIERTNARGGFRLTFRKNLRNTGQFRRRLKKYHPELALWFKELNK